MLDLAWVSTYLSEEIREIINWVDFTDAFSSASLWGLHHDRVADFFCSLAMETYSFSVYIQVSTEYLSTLIWHYEQLVKWHAYLQAILHILDAAKFIHVRRNVDYFLLLVVLCPFYCQAWERRTERILTYKQTSATLGLNLGEFRNHTLFFWIIKDSPS